MEGNKGTHARAREARELADQLSQAYQRKSGQQWTYAEQSALCEISRRPDCGVELTELLAYRERNGQFFPRSIERLLSSWSETLDQCRVPVVANGAQGKPPSVYELTKALEVKQERAKALRDRHYTDGPMGGAWTSDKAREEYRGLTKEIQGIKERIEKAV